MKTLSQLLIEAEALYVKFVGINARRVEVLSMLDEFQNKYQRESELVDVLDYVQKFFQSLGTTEQSKLQTWLEKVVSYGLQSVFGPDYKFVIIGPDVKANEIVLSFKVLDNDIERDPYTDMGGGIADVLSFILQFVLVLLLKDRIHPILMLDESFKHLAQVHRPAAANLLRELVDRTNIQIVIITHDPIFAEVADAKYEVTRQNQVSCVELLTNAVR